MTTLTLQVRPQKSHYIAECNFGQRVGRTHLEAFINLTNHLMKYGLIGSYVNLAAGGNTDEVNTKEWDENETEEDEVENEWPSQEEMP